MTDTKAQGPERIWIDNELYERHWHEGYPPSPESPYQRCYGEYVRADLTTAPTRPDTIQTVTLTEAEQAAFASGWNRALEAAAKLHDARGSSRFATETGAAMHKAWSEDIRALSMPAPTRQEAVWHPIETAPRDGTENIGYSTAEPGVCFGMKWTASKSGGWWYPFTHDPDGWEPSHWMPLPEPPK